MRAEDLDPRVKRLLTLLRPVAERLMREMTATGAQGRYMFATTFGEVTIEVTASKLRGLEASDFIVDDPVLRSRLTGEGEG